MKKLQKIIFDMLNKKYLTNNLKVECYKNDNDIIDMRISYILFKKVTTIFYFTFCTKNYLYRCSKYFEYEEGYTSLQELNGYDINFIVDIIEVVKNYG